MTASNIHRTLFNRAGALLAYRLTGACRLLLGVGALRWLSGRYRGRLPGRSRQTGPGRRLGPALLRDALLPLGGVGRLSCNGLEVSFERRQVYNIDHDRRFFTLWARLSPGGQHLERTPYSGVHKCRKYKEYQEGSANTGNVLITSLKSVKI
jgi:hypothetical protein